MTGYNTTRNRMIAGRAIISALVLAALAFCGMSAAGQLYVNKSGWWREDDAFTPADAVIALQIAAGSRPFDSRYDVSGDGKVTSLDALMILQAAAGKVDLS